MSGEHRYHSAPASEEYRENFDRIFRGKRSTDECTGLDLREIAPMMREEFKRALSQRDPYVGRELA